MAIFFTIDLNTQEIFGYDDTPLQQSLAQQRISAGQVDCGRYPVLGEVWQNGAWVQMNSLAAQKATVNLISDFIQSELDAGAAKWGYDSIVSAASYLNSATPQYAADAKALTGWRDSVWNWAFPQFPSVIAGTSPQTFTATMPAQPSQPVA